MGKPASGFQTESKIPGLDAALGELAVYLSSPEGETWLSEFESIINRIQTRSKFTANPEILLTPKEEKALAFIRSEHEVGRSPGVRKIAKAAGFKSSRSGLRLLRVLKDRGLLLT